MKDNNAVLWDWGQSMYGGYYAHVWTDTTPHGYTGIHENRLRDLRETLKRDYNITTLPTDKRRDN